MNLNLNIFYYRNDDFLFGYATIAFVCIPFILILTFGKGYEELYEAATMNTFYEKIAERHGVYAKYYFPGVKKRIFYFLQTFLSLLPGLSWIPLPKDLAETKGESNNQTLQRRKLFELFGENAPQFILQLAIKLSKKDTEITSASALLETIFKDFTIASSFFGLIMRSTSVFLELASYDKHNSKIEPYASWKDKLIVVPAMVTTIMPRILMLSVLFGSSFPLFMYDTEKTIFGLRSGLVLFLGAFVIYVIVFLIVGCVIAAKTPQLNKSDVILSGLSALVAPCLIFHQTSNILRWSSILSATKYSIIMVTFFAVLKVEPSIWNSLNDPAGNDFIIIFTGWVLIIN